MNTLQATIKRSTPVASLFADWMEGLIQRRRTRQARYALRDMPDHIKRDIGLIDGDERTRRP